MKLGIFALLCGLLIALCVAFLFLTVFNDSPEGRLSPGFLGHFLNQKNFPEPSPPETVSTTPTITPPFHGPISPTPPAPASSGEYITPGEGFRGPISPPHVNGPKGNPPPY